MGGDSMMAFQIATGGGDWIEWIVRRESVRRSFFGPVTKRLTKGSRL
jgi:hypothetical protein